MARRGRAQATFIGLITAWPSVDEQLRASDSYVPLPATQACLCCG